VRIAANQEAADSLATEVHGCLVAARSTGSSAALLGGMHLAASAAWRLKQPEFLSIGREMAELLDERRSGGGRWFPESIAADRHRLSAINGLGAVALALLRLALPDHGYGIGLID
jgi:hypothetical protein